jgi:hypothetical protein
MGTGSSSSSRLCSAHVSLLTSSNQCGIEQRQCRKKHRALEVGYKEAARYHSQLVAAALHLVQNQDRHGVTSAAITSHCVGCHSRFVALGASALLPQPTPYAALAKDVATFQGSWPVAALLRHQLLQRSHNVLGMRVFLHCSLVWHTSVFPWSKTVPLSPHHTPECCCQSRQHLLCMAEHSMLAACGRTERYACCMVTCMGMRVCADAAIPQLQ